MPDKRELFAPILFAAFGATAVFLADRFTELGVAVGIVYIGPLLLLRLTGQPAVVWAGAVVASILILVGLSVSPTGGEFAKVLANRILSVAVVWIVAASVVLLMKAAIAIKLGAQTTEQIVESAMDAVIVISRTGLITHWNPEAERLFGWSSEESKGRDMADLIFPERLRAQHREGLNRYLKSGDSRMLNSRIELSAVRRSGEEFPIELTVVSVDGQNEIRFAAFLRDITQRRRLDERIHSVVESAPNGFLMIDSAGTITLVNRATEALFGYPRSELIGKPVEMLLPERYRSEHPSSRNQFFRDAQERPMGAGRDLFGQRHDGAEIAVEIGLNPIRTEEGLFVLASIVDMTDRKRIQDELNKVNAELKARSDEMEQFVYTISHDLKSPLVTMQGFIGILSEDIAANRQDDLQDSLTRIQRAGHHMNRLLDDLLQLSRVGTVRNDPEWVDVSTMMQEIREDLSKRLEESNAQMFIADTLPSVFADRLRLRQLFENLLSNAIKYGTTAEEPEIRVAGEMEGQSVRYTVTDNGPGIPEADQARVFAVFHRLESAQDGTGLGLAVVRRIARLHGGDVTLNSRPGTGTTFIVTLPATESEPRDTADRFRLESDTAVQNH